jgi:hypothetical protein
MILGGLSLLQFKPSHEYSIGKQGSPCQFLKTEYCSLICMIASTNVFNAKTKELTYDYFKEKYNFSYVDNSEHNPYKEDRKEKKAYHHLWPLFYLEAFSTQKSR